jgi:thiol:disulfide interchange protein DsbD
MKKTLFLIFYLLCGGYTKADQNISLMYLQDNEIKPADEVFVMSYSEDGGVLKVNWSIEDGYYLYFDSILIKENQKIVDFDLTDGMIIDHEDEFFGETKIIRNILEILSSIEEIETNLIEITYQGCSDRGFCYPVQNKNIR